MLRHLTLTALAAGLGLVVPLAGQTFTNPLDITNVFHPFPAQGITLEKVFEVQQGHTDERVVHTYMTGTRSFEWPLGTGQMVDCRILEETDIEDEEVTEVSINYFAQADDGTVYYFGETVDIFDGGVLVSHEGSWLVGGPDVGDPPGTFPANDPAVFMPASPQEGSIWKPEDLLPAFPLDETAEVIKEDKTVFVPAGLYFGCIRVLESTALSDETELKWYAPGVGVIKAKEPGETLVLISTNTP